jgi:hypothetical protein
MHRKYRPTPRACRAHYAPDEHDDGSGARYLCGACHEWSSALTELDRQMRDAPAPYYVVDYGAP